MIRAFVRRSNGYLEVVPELFLVAVLFAAVAFVVAVPAGFAAVLVVFFSVAVVLATLELTFAADFALEVVAVFVVTDFLQGLSF